MSAAMDRDPREERLPAWAREIITGLRMEVRGLRGENDDMRRELALHAGDGPADSDTFVDMEHGTLGLGRRAQVRFMAGEAEFEVRMRDDGLLEVGTSASQIVVVPSATQYGVRLRGEK